MTRWQFTSTGDEVVEAFKDRVKGKTVVITGPGIGGIGAETAISLAAGLPSQIILAGRTTSKITPVITTINTKYPSVKVLFVAIDLSSQASVRTAAATINSSVTKIDILINNAAIMVCPWEKSVDGIELQFATNYLGHFLLTNLLIGKILEGGRGMRIVNVSSSAHRSGGIRFEDVNFEDGKVYNEWEAYGQSKAALILFSHALATKLGPYGGFSFSLNPGSIKSGLQVNMNEAILKDGIARLAVVEAEAGREFKREPQKTLQQGCSTTLIAALDPNIEGQNGAYLNAGDVAEYPPPEYLSEKANDERLWKLSEDLVGEVFGW